MSQADRDRWDAQWSVRDEVGTPSAVLLGLADRLPRRGRALDLAGGQGRHGLWLAARGLEVTVADVSPVALGRVRSEAAARGLSVDTLQVDLDEGVPPGPWDLIVVFNFFDRAVYRALGAALVPGGTVVIVHPTVRNLERHARPSRRFLLDEGELIGLVDGVRVVFASQGWSADGRHEAVLVAQRPAAG